MELKQKLDEQYIKQPVTLVIDSHPVHRAYNVRSYYDGFKVLSTPAYSSFFNSQETVWSVLKRELFQHFARFDQDFKKQV